MNINEWTAEDQEKALSQGWGIFQNMDTKILEIQKNDEHALFSEDVAFFETDEEALNHVTNMAVGGGSHLHFKALQCIKYFGEKPPLGLVPKSIWMRLRLKDIQEAVTRYKKAKKEIPKEWLEEAGELALKLENWE